MMWTKAKPPGNIPTNTLAKSINLRAIPPLFINCPERMKKGMASKAKLSNPVAIRWAMVVRAGLVSMLINMVVIVDIPIQNEMGTPRKRRNAKLPIRMRMWNSSIF